MSVQIKNNLFMSIVEDNGEYWLVFSNRKVVLEEHRCETREEALRRFASNCRYYGISDTVCSISDTVY